MKALAALVYQQQEPEPTPSESCAPGMGWVRQAVRVTGHRATRLVEGYVHRSAPGLAVTRAVGGSDWRITHLASGCRAGFERYPTADQAGKVACALAVVVDFRLPIEALASPDNIARIRATLIPALAAVGVAHRPSGDVDAVVEQWHDVAEQVARVLASPAPPRAPTETRNA